MWEEQNGKGGAAGTFLLRNSCVGCCVDTSYIYQNSQVIHQEGAHRRDVCQYELMVGDMQHPGEGGNDKGTAMGWRGSTVAAA